MKVVYVGTCGNKVSLDRYAKLFNALEINATFYRFPKEDSVQRWQETFSKRRDFLLSVKAFQGLTHPTNSPTWRRSGLSKEEVESLRDQVGCLKLTDVTMEFLYETLKLCSRINASVVLLQLPKACERNENAIVEFFDALREASCITSRFALEIRWSHPELLRALYEEYGVVPAFDPFLFEEFLSVLDGVDFVYFRLHGALKGGKVSYDKDYTEEELARLKEIVVSLDAKAVAVFFNNKNMHKNALTFREMIK